MPTVPIVRASRKPERTVRLIVTEHGLAIEIALTQGARSESCYYHLTRLRNSFGVAAFQLTKFSCEPVSEERPERYAVLVDGDHSHCECLGHLRWGKPCKHVAALQDLFAAGQLGDAPTGR
jgi:hypothetical protein